MHADIDLKPCLVMPFPALAQPRREVLAAMGVSEADFEACRDMEAVACRVVLFAILVHHHRQDQRIARDFLSIPPEEAIKIAELFRTYFLIYAVPKDMRDGPLALSMRKFMAGKEERVDFAALMRAKPRARVSPFDAIERCGDGAPSQSMADIVASVSEYLGVSAADIKSDRRSPDMMRARHVAIYACRILTPTSLVAIGRFFGGRDHSTVIYACKSVEGLIDGRPDDGMRLIDLLDHIAARVPAVAELHAAASLRAKKREMTFFSPETRDIAYREAA